MFYDLAKSRRVQLAAVILPLAACALVLLNTSSSSVQIFSIIGKPGISANSDAISEMKTLLAEDRRRLAGLEREQSRLRLDVINQRKLHQEGRVSKQQVQETEQLFIAALKRVHEMRNAVTETDIAIAEAVLGEKVNRLPRLPVNGYSESADLARFNGGFKWSIREAPRIEKYFSQAFGRRLPVTALGQSDTHNRLNFDHRDAMDVAVHPDSSEGKALIDHLRKSGIPYIAFRGSVPGTSTGPHIHIGKPSGRLAR